MRGGKRSGAGRRAGSKNRARLEIVQKATEAGLTPLDYMLSLLRSDSPEGADVIAKVRHEALRFEAAKAAAPYLHPRLNAIEHTGKDGGPLEIVHRMANA